MNVPENIGPISPIGPSQWHRASELSRALALPKRTIHRRAQAEHWPTRQIANHLEYQPPPEVAAAISSVPSAPSVASPRAVSFAALTHDPTQRAKVLAREAVVLHLRAQLDAGAPKAVAIASAVLHAQRLDLSASYSSVHRWDQAYAQHGLDGLVEQKLGKVGRKCCLDQLSPDQLNTLTVRGKALALEHGHGGRPNVARAARELAAQPDLAAPIREHLHGAHSTKSYVTPSIRAAITVAPLTGALAMGTSHARLSSRWTPHDYSDVHAGDWFVSDDMTSNIIAWCEWPNALGYRLGQPQILPVLDIGSLRWLNVRVIIRDSGQYTSDDIAGLFGDVFDLFGLPHRGFVLEGGIWQANKIRGYRTDIADEERIGGLKALGLEVYHAHTPGEKPIEERFNQLQAAMDRFPGFIGREQRYDVQESTDKLREQCEKGKLHPRGIFPHISQLANHVQTVMEASNQEENEGVILRGKTPLEKWAEDAPVKREIPPESRWLYRSGMRYVKITRNGVRITQGTGPKKLTYYYDNPELFTRLEGEKVIVYWNDHNPDADAVILSVRPRRFIGIAPRVPVLSKFDATPEERASERARKRAAMNYARSELRSIQPELVRNARVEPIAADAEAEKIGHAIADSATRAAASARQAAQTRRHTRAVDVSPEDLAAATAAVAVAGRQATPEISPEEISDLFSDNPQP